jgi:hypothetical protein
MLAVLLRTRRQATKLEIGTLLEILSTWAAWESIACASS